MEDHPGIRELSHQETRQISGGDYLSYTWGTYVGRAARRGWDAWCSYVASDAASEEFVP